MRSLWILLVVLVLTGCMPAHRETYLVEEYVETPVLIPPPAPVVVRTPKPIAKPLIVIDAGHGGEDFGTKASTLPKCYEKNINLSTSQMLKNLLVQKGFQVVMTREDDTFVSLGDRAKFANQQKPVLFVSVHYNSAPSEKAAGVEVFYYNNEQDKTRSESSKKLAQAVLDHVLENTKAKSRGVKHGNLAVIRETNMPAILIEGGFLTNEAESQKLRDPSYQKSLAWGITQGIQEYISAAKD